MPLLQFGVDVDVATDPGDQRWADAADYIVWRDNFGASTPLINETARLGTVDDQDYLAWRANPGAVSSSRLTASAGAVVPAPRSVFHAYCGLSAGWRHLRRS